MKHKITFIDLFAGIGGFRLALESLGAECVFTCDNDSKVQETYKNNFGEEEIFGDISLLKPKSVPNHDILCAGFPCQPFSRSGKMLGFKDTRGTLFFEILRIAKAKKPKVILLENVANLAQHDKGRTYKIIKYNLEQLGYVVSEQVLNAKNFGLAQNRERFIIVASHKKFNFNKIKFSKQKVNLKDLISSTGRKILDPKEYTILPPHLWKTQASGLIFCGYRNKALRTTGVRENTEHLSRVHKQPNRIYHIDGTHPTLSAQETSGRYFVYDGSKVFQLGVNDCYELQGFPKNFKKHLQTSQQYKQIGNAVPVNIIKAVGEQIIEQLLRN